MRTGAKIYEVRAEINGKEKVVKDFYCRLSASSLKLRIQEMGHRAWITTTY